MSSEITNMRCTLNGEEIDGYVIFDRNRPDFGNALSTMGAIQLFTNINIAKDMIRLCSNNENDWVVVPVRVKRK